MSTSQRLALSILDHLAQCSNGISVEKAETLEVAIQCLEQVFDVESYDDNKKESMKVDKSLQEIFDTYVKEKMPEQKSDSSTVLEPSRKDREKAEELKAEGNQLMKAEKFQEAINSYTQAITLDNTNPVYPCNRAAAYGKLGQHDKAIEDCKRALKLDPKYSKGYGRMGLSYQNINNLPKAQECYKKAIELEPDNAFYKNNLKVIEEAIGQRPGGTPPNLGQGMPNIGNMDFASLFSNPAVMNMAQNFMQSPQMQQMVSNLMTGGSMGGPGMGGGDMAGGGGGGMAGGSGATGGGPAAGPAGMSQLFQAAQRFGEQLQESNPELMTDLRAQAQQTFHREPNSNPFSSSYDKPPEEKGDDKKE